MEKLGFEIMAKKWPKWRFLWDKMSILIPIGLKIGLPITLHVNDGQNKLEVCISKNMAKMAKKWLKNCRAATFGQSWDGHNSAILHPIWTFDPTKMISSSRRIDWCKDLSSISFRLDFCFYGHFLPLVATWSHNGDLTQKSKKTTSFPYSIPNICRKPHSKIF